MITVTRLKTSVNNPDLPVLLDDGTVANFYVGNYIATMRSNEYVLSDAQIAALNAFVNSGISSGWIQYVKYFLPCLGSLTNPITGAVPLIDKVGNYAMAEYDGTEDFSKVFAGENNEIKYIHQSGSVALKTPVKWEDLENSFSVLFSRKMQASPADNYNAYLAGCYDVGGTYRRIALRLQKLAQQVYYKESSLTDAVIKTIRPRASEDYPDSIPNTISGLWSVRVDARTGRTVSFRAFSIDGGTPNIGSGDWTAEMEISNAAFGANAQKFGIGLAEVAPQRIADDVKCIGLFDPYIPDAMVTRLISDMDALNTALGK